MTDHEVPEVVPAGGDPKAAERWAEERAGLINAAKAERDKRQALEAEAAELRRKTSEASGEFRPLYEAELNAKIAAETKAADATAKLDAAEKRIEAIRETRRAALPESIRALIPDGLAGDSLDSLIDRLEAHAKATPANGTTTVDPTARTYGGADPSALTEAERKYAESQPGWYANGKLLVSPANVRKHFARFGGGSTARP